MRQAITPVLALPLAEWTALPALPPSNDDDHDFNFLQKRSPRRNSIAGGYVRIDELVGKVMLHRALGKSIKRSKWQKRVKAFNDPRKAGVIGIIKAYKFKQRREGKNREIHIAAWKELAEDKLD